MKLASLAIASALLFVVPAAQAADMALKAPPPPAPVPTWTGFYLGLNAGGAWSNNSDISNGINSTFCNTTLGGCAPNQWSNALAAAVPPIFPMGHNASFIGGGQIGYNYQSGQAVWGIEADFQGLDLHNSSAVTNAVSIVTAPITTATVAGAATEKLDFIGTFRGRLGWTPTAPWLLYLTGGLAYGHTNTSVAFSSHFTNCFCGANPASVATTDEWRAGWTVGGGLEWMVAPKWSIKGEYLYYDLGHVTLNSTLNQLNGAATPFVNVGITSTERYSGSIARVGVNYKLN